MSEPRVFQFYTGTTYAQEYSLAATSGVLITEFELVNGSADTFEATGAPVYNHADGCVYFHAQKNGATGVFAKFDPNSMLVVLDAARGGLSLVDVQGDHLWAYDTGSGVDLYALDTTTFAQNFVATPAEFGDVSNLLAATGGRILGMDAVAVDFTVLTITSPTTYSFATVTAPAYSYPWANSVGTQRPYCIDDDKMFVYFGDDGGVGGIAGALVDLGSMTATDIAAPGASGSEGSYPRWDKASNTISYSWGATFNTRVFDIDSETELGGVGDDSAGNTWNLYGVAFPLDDGTTLIPGDDSGDPIMGRFSLTAPGDPPITIYKSSNTTTTNAGSFEPGFSSPLLIIPAAPVAGPFWTNFVLTSEI